MTPREQQRFTNERLWLTEGGLASERQVPCHHVGQPLGHSLGKCSIVGLDHDPHQWLGPGLAQEHPANPGELGFGGTNLGLNRLVPLHPALVHALDVDQAPAAAAS